VENNTIVGADILLDKLFSLEMIRTTFIKLLGVGQSEESVVVGHDVERLNVPSSCRLLVIANETKGQMCQMLELYFRKSYDADMDIEQLVVNLCSELDCDSLISDDDVNPFSMIKINAKGEVQKVFLDPEALDNDEYVVSPDS